MIQESVKLHSNKDIYVFIMLYGMNFYYFKHFLKIQNVRPKGYLRYLVQIHPLTKEELENPRV